MPLIGNADATHVWPLLEEYAAAVPDVALVAEHVVPIQLDARHAAVDGIAADTQLDPLLALYADSAFDVEFVTEQ